MARTYLSLTPSYYQHRCIQSISFCCTLSLFLLPVWFIGQWLIEAFVVGLLISKIYWLSHTEKKLDFWFDAQGRCGWAGKADTTIYTIQSISIVSHYACFLYLRTQKITADDQPINLLFSIGRWQIIFADSLSNTHFRQLCRTIIYLKMSTNN